MINKNRKYTVNDDFFENVNMENSYYAGFIAADGCISKHKGSVSLKIEISEKDKNFLETFLKEIDSNNPIRYRVCHKKFKMCGIEITSKKIASDLEKNFNITERKSLTLSPPNLIDRNIALSFICGYIDGDGSVFINSRNNAQLSILGTEKMLTWIKNVLSDISNNKGSIKLKPNTKIFRLDYSTESARNIIKEICSLNVSKLKRKFNDTIFNFVKNYKKGHNDTSKEVFVFDLYGNLKHRCHNAEEASKLTNVNKCVIHSNVLCEENRKQSNGFMFSYKNKIQKFSPKTNWSGWSKTKMHLLQIGAIKNENDF